MITCEKYHQVRRFPFNNGFNLFWINGYALGRYDMTKINDFRNPELTFGEFGIEAMFAKLHEDETKMFFMLFFRLGVHKNVIKIYHNELVEVFMENRVHESRESRRCTYVAPLKCVALRPRLLQT